MQKFTDRGITIAVGPAPIASLPTVLVEMDEFGDVTSLYLSPNGALQLADALQAEAGVPVRTKVKAKRKGARR